MIDRNHTLPVKRQCELLGVARSTAYYRPEAVSQGDLEAMRRIDELHLRYPFAGSRMLCDSVVERRVILELYLLAVLTVVFLVVFPERPMRVEVGLALFALTLLLLNLRYTKYVIWKPFPCARGRRLRLRKALLLVGAMTGLRRILEQHYRPNGL